MAQYFDTYSKIAGTNRYFVGSSRLVVLLFTGVNGNRTGYPTFNWSVLIVYHSFHMMQEDPPERTKKEQSLPKERMANAGMSSDLLSWCSTLPPGRRWMGGGQGRKSSTSVPRKMAGHIALIDSFVQRCEFSSEYGCSPGARTEEVTRIFLPIPWPNIPRVPLRYQARWLIQRLSI